LVRHRVFWLRDIYYLNGYSVKEKSMEIDKTAVGFNSSPLYRFLLQEGKFKGVEFYFKNVELDHKNTPGAFDIAFEYEIIGGNYSADG